MDSMLSGMKRAAAVLQTTAKGSGDLGMVIYHQKEVAESWSRLAHAKLDGETLIITSVNLYRTLHASYLCNDMERILNSFYSKWHTGPSRRDYPERSFRVSNAESAARTAIRQTRVHEQDLCDGVLPTPARHRDMVGSRSFAFVLHLVGYGTCKLSRSHRSLAQPPLLVRFLV